MASDARRRGVGTRIGELGGQVPLGRRSVRPFGEQCFACPEFDTGDPSSSRPRSTAEADLAVSAGRACKCGAVRLSPVAQVSRR